MHEALPWRDKTLAWIIQVILLISDNLLTSGIKYQKRKILVMFVVC